MNKYLTLLLSAVLCGFHIVSHAGRIYECFDNQGNRSFSDVCPPGTTKKSEKILRTERTGATAGLETVAKEYPVTLYSVQACDACDLVRRHLQNRKIPFTEKDSAQDAAVQEQLKALVGQLTVPTVTIGKKVITGYNRFALEDALDGAGYPVNPPAAEQ